MCRSRKSCCSRRRPTKAALAVTAASHLLDRLDLSSPTPAAAAKPWIRALSTATASNGHNDGSHEVSAMVNANNAGPPVPVTDRLKGGEVGACVRSMSSVTLPTYEMAVAGTNHATAAPPAATGPSVQAETAVFRTVIRGVKALRLDAASRQALVRLPVTGSFEELERALVAGIGEHLQKVAANSTGWKGRRIARMNAFVVEDIRVVWEQRGCGGGYGERMDEGSWERMLALFGQRGWRDELEVELEVR